ncbi:MAG: hypothetical protein P4L53_06510 [Candidatus Obscuribacterales bacterium]|nr:hypothetical protein [Candidatus Obscuribacterales bacterium]
MSVSKIFLSFALVALALASAGAGLAVYRAPEKKVAPPRLPDVLLDLPATSPTHLYPARGLALDDRAGASIAPNRSRAVVGSDGLNVASYIDNQDDSASVVSFQGDGQAVSMVREYYPSTDVLGSRQLKVRRTYGVDGITLRSEARFRREDGSQEYAGHLLVDGSYQAFTLFGDGRTAETETVTIPDEFETNHAPKLLRFQKWQEAGHVLIYHDVLNDDGGSRDIKKFDSQGLLTLAKHIGMHGVVGTTVTAYYPGSTRVAMHSVTTISETDATFFRPDGTKNFEQVLTTYGTGVSWFDVAGIIKLFHQDWFTSDPNDNSALHPRLWQVAECNEKGDTTRLVTFNNGVLTRQVFYNLTLKGILYSIVTLDYDEAGKLRLSAVTPADKKVVVPPVETLGLSQISTEVDVREKVALDLTYELPVPQPSRHDRD